MSVRSLSIVGTCCAVVLMTAGPALSAPIILFNETFNGYTQFPINLPVGDPFNPGMPEKLEGASEFWYAARFETGAEAMVDDVGIQKWGCGQNQTPVGRVEDDGGILFRIDTTGYDQVVLEFDWRTFNASTDGRFTAGYHVGDNLGIDSGANRTTTQQDWSHWVQLLRRTPYDIFEHKIFNLPGNVGPVWVAFWMDDEEGHYGKVDNIKVTADMTSVIPEPSTLALVIVPLLARRRFRLV